MAELVEMTAGQLQPGDIAILRHPGALSDSALARIAKDWELFCEKAGLARIPVLVLEEGMTLETIPRDRLRRMGWVRAEGEHGT
jgi:hypothetical protein